MCTRNFRCRWPQLLLVLLSWTAGLAWTNSAQGQSLRPAKNIQTGSRQAASQTDNSLLPDVPTVNAEALWGLLSGDWACESAEMGGQALPASLVEPMRIRFQPTRAAAAHSEFVSTNAVGEDRGQLRWGGPATRENLEQSVADSAIKTGVPICRVQLVSAPQSNLEKTMKAILRVSADGSTLEICCGEGEYPDSFRAERTNGRYRVVYRKVQ